MSDGTQTVIQTNDIAVDKLESWSTRLVLVINWILGTLYFRVFNRVVVHSNAGIPKERGILFLASHYTMVDSWIIGLLYTPYDAIYRPWVIPHNVPEKTNFYKGKFTSWWFDHSKCIPILRDSGGRNTHPKVIDALKRSNVLIFPSSTRYRGITEKGRNSPSLGRLIHNSGARKIVPINLKGLPYKGGFFPVWFKKIDITIGEPINPLDLGPAETKEECQEVVQKVRQIIEQL